MLVREHVHHAGHHARDPRGDLLELPPVLYGQAEAGRHRWPGGPVPSALRAEDILNRGDVERWLALYGRAWETMDPDTAVELFTQDATYQETPFDEVMRGRPAIHAYWAEIPDYHRDVSFESEVLTVDGDRALAHWWVSLFRVKSGERTKSDGIFLLDFEEGTGLCRSLREWWHVGPETPAGA
jgi:ketosteroid isomerase-like protein